MLNEVITVLLAVLNVGVALYVLINARRLFKKEPEWLNEFVEDKKVSVIEGANDFIDQKIASFMAVDPETGVNFVDALAARFGKGFRMSLLAQKSGEARHTQMIENRVFDAMKDQSPELKLGLQALDKFGLGDLATPENLPALLQIAQKYGLFGNFLQHNAGGGREPNRGNVPVM